jgi:hypothetical protein
MCSQKKQQTLVSNNVSGGLVSPSKTKPWTDIEPNEGPSQLSQPESILWLAVIDKAITDYVCPMSDLSPIYKRGLEWFFFDNKPEPFNLIYICDMIFDDDTSVDAVRRRVQKLKSSDEELKRFAKKRYALRINSKYY